MEEKIFIETTLTTWNDIFKLPQRFMDKFIYRGQGNSNWELKSSLERSINKFYPNNTDNMLSFIEEKTLLKEFMWKYPLYSMSVPKKDELVEWLTIMQHYGAPTRLIDITKSIFIAIYFALAETVFDNSSIWAINEHIITMPVIEKYFLETNAKMVSHEVIKKKCYDKRTKY